MDIKADFPAARGGVPDMRPNGEKPYSVQSYAAQYGVPVKDVSEFLEQRKGATHGDVREFIQREYLTDESFRIAAIQHATRPFSELSDGEKLQQDIHRTSHDAANRLRLGLKSGAIATKSIPEVESVEIDAEGHR